MMELILEKEKPLYLEYFKMTNKEFMKTRLKWMLFISIAYGVLLFFYMNTKTLIGIPFVLLFAYKLPYYNLTELKKKEDLIRQYVFPKFLTTFINLIGKEGNVYSTLVASSEYMDGVFKEKLEGLIVDIDNNPTNSRDAFMKFAKYIGTPEANNVMNTIHSFEESGIQQDELDDFEDLIMKMEKDRKDEVIKRRVSLMLHLHSNPISMYVIFYILILVFVIWSGTVGSIEF